MGAGIWGITAHIDVFALHVSVRILDGGAGRKLHLTPAVADGVSIAVEYSNGASIMGELGRHGSGRGLDLAVMESQVTDQRIDAHVALSPLPSAGDVHIHLALRKGGPKLGEWHLSGEDIVEAGRKAAAYEA
jgi:hypothetical protein